MYLNHNHLMYLTTSVHPTSDADIILHPENSGPPKGKPLQVISKGIPPEEMSDTDLDEELQHPKHPIKVKIKKRGNGQTQMKMMCHH